MIRGLKVDYNKVNENLSTLGKHINNASNQFGNVTLSFQKIGQKLEKSNELKNDFDKTISSTQENLP